MSWEPASWLLHPSNVSKIERQIISFLMKIFFWYKRLTGSWQRWSELHPPSPAPATPTPPTSDATEALRSVATAMMAAVHVATDIPSLATLSRDGNE